MSEANWAALIMVVNGLGIAFIAYLNNRRSTHIEAKVAEVKENVVKVEKIVDGPLSLALRELAEIKRKVANDSGRPEDEMAATKAEAINKNREEGKNE